MGLCGTNRLNTVGISATRARKCDDCIEQAYNTDQYIYVISACQKSELFLRLLPYGIKWFALITMHKYILSYSLMYLYKMLLTFSRNSNQLRECVCGAIILFWDVK